MCKADTGNVLPSHLSEMDLANRFASYFHDKISVIRENLDTAASTELSVTMQESCSVVFDTFSEVSNETIRKVIMNSPTKSNSLDPIPTFLLKTCVDSLVPIITRFVNTSLLSGIVPDQLKTSCVAPILKKPKLNHEELKTIARFQI